ncbi:DUF2804 domain-containing protein [Salinispira pacifica]|uniref:DUF2804 domain-containing protein n=1 Tax=Salinispira pacifica TaxID=1307761 RepID=V5WFP1_9SPIO|nr:DUF2804 domain-containing protein [Salinispira pacifica]AHC13986.1 hypothetical protein L21SP2_0554 [Salinispira pacifica]
MSTPIYTENEITEVRPLLNEDGTISAEGWSRRPLWQYSRDAVAAPWFRIKEWDYYYVISPELKRGITFTISDLGYAGLIALCWVDFEKEEVHQLDTISWFPRGGIFHPETAGAAGDNHRGRSERSPGGARAFSPDSGRVSFSNDDISLSFEAVDGQRRIRVSAPDMKFPDGSKGLEGELVLNQPPELESMNIATSWKKNRKRFYYNRKINNMSAAGTIRAGRRSYFFRDEDSMGGLDWGRGAWTYKNRWFWASMSGRLEGTPFGFNLGYGFTDRSPASENMLFYDGKAHKLGEVRFEFDPESYYRPWSMSSSDGRLELAFTPAVDRSSSTNFLIIRSVQHQVFGYFSGIAVLDNGEKLSFRNMPGFAEDVFNRW